MSLELKQSGVELNGGAIQAHSLQSSVTFDLHKIVHIQKLLARFPHTLSSSGESEGEGEDGEMEGRKKFKEQLAIEKNEVM